MHVGSRILEAGCGIGELTQYFAFLGFQAAGLDECVETIADAFETQQNDLTAGINIVGGSDVDSDDDLAKQKSQAEKDLIEALRQVR